VPGQKEADRRQQVEDKAIPHILAAVEKVQLAQNGQAQRGDEQQPRYPTAPFCH
jgi:hypothetical protein